MIMRSKLEQINLMKWKNKTKKWSQKSIRQIKKLNKCKIKLINCSLIKKYRLKNNKKIPSVPISKTKTKNSFNKSKPTLKAPNSTNKLSKKWKIKIKNSSLKLTTLSKKSWEQNMILNLLKMK